MSRSDVKIPDPDEPGIDAETRKGRRALKILQAMSDEEFDRLLVFAGIYDEDGNLTEHYRSDGPPSAMRPTD
jgi:hypothetical protein